MPSRQPHRFAMHVMGRTAGQLFAPNAACGFPRVCLVRLPRASLVQVKRSWRAETEIRMIGKDAREAKLHLVLMLSPDIYMLHTMGAESGDEEMSTRGSS
jgi:hypothetical protein